MSERKTIKIDQEIYNQLHEIKQIKQYRSINQTLQNLIPTGITHQTDYEQEPPAFTITNHTISWTTLKKAKPQTAYSSAEDKYIFHQKSEDFSSLFIIRFC